MHAPDDSGMPGQAPAVDGARLVALLRADEIDRAIEAGLMAFVDDPALDPASRELIHATRRRLLEAWQARERYRARQVRLARRRAEREARRGATPVVAAAGTPALPAAAAAALARAKARAASR